MGEMVLVSGLFLGLCGTSCIKEEQPNQTQRNPRDLVHGRLLLAMLDRFSSKNAPQGEFISTRRAVGSLGVAPYPCDAKTWRPSAYKCSAYGNIWRRNLPAWHRPVTKRHPFGASMPGRFSLVI